MLIHDLTKNRSEPAQIGDDVGCGTDHRTGVVPPPVVAPPTTVFTMPNSVAASLSGVAIAGGALGISVFAIDNPT